ncbi:ATP-dependent DNA ligase [Candidatus Dependentiae bacterium]|nr:ATP-dependent DNA ligase [Candidatus Dependentiae bacterium]
MKFHLLAEALLALEKEASRTKMTELLAALLAQATPHEAQIISYLTLGTLRAQYKANTFNFAEKSMLKLLAPLVGQTAADFASAVRQSGDIGGALLKAQWPTKDRSVTLLEVYKQLENLQELSGTNSQEEKGALLAALLQQVDVLSASFIVRMVLGTMRLGFSDMTLIDALSWMATGGKSLKKSLEHAYNLCADIGFIAFLLKEQGTDALSSVHPTIGIPIRLAAADRGENALAIIEKIGPCYAQPKLDGFRLQIHIDNKQGRVWFFSRNLHDMSSMFPDLEKPLKALKVDTLIIEGEAIVYDEETQSFLPFQETVKRKRKHNIEEVAETLPLRLFLFDILYVNGKPVLDKPHTERRALLEQYCGSLPDQKIQVIEERYCSSAQELAEYFSQQITRGLEGLVVKRGDAAYQPGKRNSNWIKLKRHEEGHLRDTVDAVILGYYAGMGKRASFQIGAFLVGIYNKEKDRFETIAKVGTGLKDDEWIELKKVCDAQKVDEKPHNVICASELAPDIWTTPSTVVVILADEITQSPLHTAGKTDHHLGFALRFPRFMGYAIDKAATQATSVDEIQKLYKVQYTS